MIVVVDLDDVLFRTKEFKVPFFALLAEQSGLDSDSVMKSYREVQEKRGFYDVDLHLQLLSKLGGRATDTELVSAIGEFLRENAQAFSFADSVDFLKEFRARQWFPYVLTRGTEWFQRCKIYSVGIHHFLSGIQVIPGEDKVPAFHGLMGRGKSGPFVFLDDSPRAIWHVRGAFSEMPIIQVRRYEDSPPTCAEASASAANLADALQLIDGFR
ncbi:MAG: hypothetical protein Q8P01_00975 [bacterium]|nr:hypothetical protein [bacterium]